MDRILKHVSPGNHQSNRKNLQNASYIKIFRQQKQIPVISTSSKHISTLCFLLQIGPKTKPHLSQVQNPSPPTPNGGKTTTPPSHLQLTPVAGPKKRRGIERVQRERPVKDPRVSLVGGWTNPSEKYARQFGSFPQGSGWTYQIFELPPPRDSLVLIFFSLTQIFCWWV